MKHFDCDADILTQTCCRLEESVREDLRYLKTHHLVRRELADNAKGYVWDIKTGKLSPIGYEG